MTNSNIWTNKYIVHISTYIQFVHVLVGNSWWCVLFCRELAKWIWSWQIIACLGWVAMIYLKESRSVNILLFPLPRHLPYIPSLFLNFINRIHSFILSWCIALKNMPNIPFYNFSLKILTIIVHLHSAKESTSNLIQWF
jgi:hypothetical protein